MINIDGNLVQVRIDPDQGERGHNLTGAGIGQAGASVRIQVGPTDIDATAYRGPRFGVIGTDGPRDGLVAGQRRGRRVGTIDVDSPQHPDPARRPIVGLADPG